MAGEPAVPTPEQIEAACREIRKLWSPEERRLREALILPDETPAEAVPNDSAEPAIAEANGNGVRK
jgi:hypothetical protein